MNTRYRSFSKTVIIPSAFFIRTLRKLIPSKKNILWAIPEQDRKWIRSRLNHESSQSGPSFYYGSEKSLIRFIKEKTQIHNKNNITRTEATITSLKTTVKYIGHSLHIWYRGMPAII